MRRRRSCVLDFALTDEQRDLVANVRRYLAEQILPDVARSESASTPLPGAFQKLATIGVVGLPFPHAYGGAGLDYVTLGLVCEELEYCDTALRTMMSVHIGLAGCGIYQWGTEEQKQRLLRPLASGEKLGAFGLTEPDAGSDVGALRSTAKRDGDEYVLNGSKIWISCATQADTFLLFAKTDPDCRQARDQRVCGGAHNRRRAAAHVCNQAQVWRSSRRHWGTIVYRLASSRTQSSGSRG